MALAAATNKSAYRSGWGFGHHPPRRFGSFQIS
jgi:hypothetical protein